MPVFILSDFQMANSYKVIAQPKSTQMDNAEDIPDHVLEHFAIERLPDDIEMVRDVQAIPGTPGKTRRITQALNTDNEGKVNYFAGTNQRSHTVRNEKVHHIQRALKKPQLYGGVEEGELLLVGWGTTEGALSEAVHDLQKEGYSVSGMCFKMIYPLPLMLKEIFSKFKYIATIELAYGDELKRPTIGNVFTF